MVILCKLLFIIGGIMFLVMINPFIAGEMFLAKEITQKSKCGILGLLYLCAIVGAFLHCKTLILNLW